MNLPVQVEASIERVRCPPCQAVQFVRAAGGDQTGSVHN